MRAGAEVVVGAAGWHRSMIGLFSKPQSYHLVDKLDLLLGGSALRPGLGSRKPRKVAIHAPAVGSLSLYEAGVVWKETQGSQPER